MSARLAATALLLTLACGGPPAELSGDDRRRYVALEGAANFRDLGGYATGDGRTVRWGRLYRSDALAGLTSADLEVVKALGIRLVCDFRTPGERGAAPDRLPDDPAPHLALLPIGSEAVNPDDLRQRILSGNLEGIDMQQLLVEGNRAFAREFASQYAAMFERISDPENLPALVHCTAGKDRAGFASALILRALGVPEQTVFEDYLKTNLYTARETESRLFWLRVFSLFRTDPEQVRPLLEARRPYLQAAFDTLEADHGSFDAYLRDALGVSSAEQRALQERLLE